jgi:hypothetical protein
MKEKVRIDETHHCELEIHEHFINFKVYEEFTETVVTNTDFVAFHERLIFDGHLKWDGCMDIMFKNGEGNFMTHFCGPKDIDEFNALLKWVWTQGPKIPKWDFV